MREPLKKAFCGLGMGPLARRVRTGAYRWGDVVGGMLLSVRGRFVHRSEQQPLPLSLVKKIILIRIDRIGDLVLSTPAIRAVRSVFPQAQINALVSPYAADIIIANPHIDRVLRNGVDVVTRDYDLAIAFHPGWQPNRIAFASGARMRIGFSGQGGGFWLTHHIPDDRDTRIQHEVDFVLQALRPLGISPADRRLEVSVTDDGERFAQEFWQRHNIRGTVIFLQPGAQQQYVRWRLEGFSAVCRRLVEEHHVTIIVSASQSETALVSALSSAVPQGLISCVGERLTNIISLMRKSTLYLGNVTGPMHIASALNLPIVAITGMQGSRDDIRCWAPLSSDIILVRHEMPCARCHPGDCANIRCMREISEDEVFAAAEKMVKKYG